MERKETFKSKNKLVNKILKYVDKINGEAIIDEENKTINAKFSATMTGGYMANDWFTPKQLEQLGLVIDAKIEPIKKDIKDIKERLTSVEERLTNVEDRLTNVENRLTKIENCSTIKNEIEKD